MGLAICLISVFALLVVKVYEVDWKMGLYSTHMLFIIVCFGNILSYPRFLSFIFPLWLIFKVRRSWHIIPAIVALAYGSN